LGGCVRINIKLIGRVDFYLLDESREKNGVSLYRYKKNSAR